MSGIVFAASSASASLVDVGSLKSDVPARVTSLNRPGTTCATWSTEGDVFIGNSDGSVRRLDGKGALLGTVFTGSEPVVTLTMKDSRFLVVALSQSVHVVDTANTDIKETYSIVTTSTPIKSTSLSHDKELLCIITEGGILIHNLLTNSSVPLNRRGLPSALSNALFHPTRRSTLVICCGAQLVILDVMKPSTPLKTIALGSPVVDATFLPSGRNLLAAVLQNGDVCIIDMDKDKSITKKLELKQSLTAISVSADNMLLLIGTSDGHILVHDARSVEKALGRIPVGNGEPVMSLVSQKKSTAVRSTKALSSASLVTRAQPLGDNNVQRTLASARTTRKASVEVALGSKESTARAKALRGTSVVTPVKLRKPPSRAESTRSDAESVATTPVKDLSDRQSKRGSPITTKYVTTRQVPRRVMSTSSVAQVSAGNSPVTSPGSSRRSVIRPRKSEESPALAGKKNERRISPAISRVTTERTLTPDLPGMSEVSMAYQGYSTKMVPSVDSVEDTDVTVGIAPSIAVDLSTPPKQPRVRDYAEPKNITSDRRFGTPVNSNAAYDSPGFLTPDGYHGTSTPPRRINHPAENPGAMQISPMRSPAPRLSAPTSTEAQEFLRNVVREAMLEREEEQREELRALHVDMVKMGRAWKNELRTLMQEYVGDFNAIRLDNERLRAENERLRRGY